MSTHFDSTHFASTHFDSTHFGGLGIEPTPFTPDDVPHPPGTKRRDPEALWRRIHAEDELLLQVIMVFLQIKDDN